MVITSIYGCYSSPSLDTSFQKAVYNGRFEKVKEIIRKEEDNIYRSSDDSDESNLFIAIARDHIDVANLLLDIYEHDLRAVENFFLKININKSFWIRETISLAFGNEHIKLVKDLVGHLSIQTASEMVKQNRKGLILLLKTNNLSEPEVLWITPRNHEDCQQIAQVMERICNDGYIELMIQQYSNYSLATIASVRNHKDIFCRVVKLLKGTLKSHEFIECFCLLCSFVGNRLETFLSLCHEFGINDDLQISIDSLKHPFRLNQFDIFEYLLHQMVSDNNTFTSLLNTVVTESNEILIKHTFDGKGFTTFCLKYPESLITGRRILNANLRIRTCKANEELEHFILENYKDIFKCKNNILKLLIKNNWVTVVQKLYVTYPICQKYLFESYTEGIKTLKHCCDYRYVDSAVFLIQEHNEHLKFEVMCSIVRNCADNYKFTPIIAAILKTSTFIEGNKNTSKNTDFMEALFIALKHHRLKNYNCLRDAATNIKGNKMLFFQLHNISLNCL